MSTNKARPIFRPVLQNRRRLRNRTKRKLPGNYILSWVLLMNIWVVVLSLWLFVSAHNAQGYCENDRKGQGVRVALSSPQYLSIGDENEIDITVLNERSEATTITVTLSYQGSSLCLTRDDARDSVAFKSVPSQGRASSAVQVRFPPCFEQSSFHNHPGEQASFKVWLTVGKQSPQDLGDLSVPIMPLPMSRKMGSMLGALLLGLTAFWAKELWDSIKKAAEPSEKGT